MGWFDWSDWGAASWQEDVDAAVVEAHRQVTETADARGWSSYWRGTLDGLVEAADEADHDTAFEFWRDLYSRAFEFSRQLQAGGVELPDGWVKRVNVWQSAAQAADTLEDAREQGSVSTVVSGTLDGAVETAGRITDPTRSLVPWAVGAAVLGGLWIFAGRGK